jgi:hypothetical protein
MFLSTETAEIIQSNTEMAKILQRKALFLALDVTFIACKEMNPLFFVDDLIPNLI